MRFHFYKAENPKHLFSQYVMACWRWGGLAFYIQDEVIDEFVFLDFRFVWKNKDRKLAFIVLNVQAGVMLQLLSDSI